MSEIRIFENPEFGKIRTVGLPDGQVGFVGKDVAEALGYVNPTKAIMRHVDNEDKLHSQIGNTGQMRDMLVISESGLYALILSSKLPQAKAFKRWVTNEVLPQIRKTGGYIPVQEEDNEKTILAKAVQILQRTVEKKDSLIAECKTVIGRQSAEIQQQTIMLVEQSLQIDEKSKLVKEQHHLIEEQDIMLEEQHHQLEEQDIKLEKQHHLLEEQGIKLEKQKPLVEFAQTVGVSADNCTIAELAKMLCNHGFEIGQNRLFSMLRDLKYLGTSEHHWNVPQQRWIEAGYFVVKISNAWFDAEGKAHHSITPLVTGKGQQYFINKFRRL